jgi:hypothetical protein
VTKNKTWKDIAGLLGIGASSSAAYTLRKHYTKNLLAFECHFDRGGIDPQPIINQVEASSKKKNTKATSVPSPGQCSYSWILLYLAVNSLIKMKVSLLCITVVVIIVFLSALEHTTCQQFNILLNCNVFHLGLTLDRT